MNKFKSFLKLGGGIFGLVITILLLIIVGPLCLIWGLNLIGIDTPYTFGSIFGSFLIMLVLRGGSSSKS